MTIIRAAIRLTPALIGKRQQHDRSSVSFTEHWHIQQQHTKASLFATANFALSAEFKFADFDDCFDDTDGAFAGAGAASGFYSSLFSSGFNGA